MANDLSRFKLKLTHCLWGHQTSYSTLQRRLLYSASLLLGATEQLLITHVDPTTTLLPSSWDVDTLFCELENFFGGAATLQSREGEICAPSNKEVQYQIWPSNSKLLPILLTPPGLITSSFSSFLKSYVKASVLS